MKQIFIGILLIGLLSGCYNQQQVDEFNQRSFNSPKFIGNINGQALYRIEVARVGQDSSRNHFVYFFSTNPVVTVNGSTGGKHSYQKVEVFLNGNPILVTNIP